MAVGAASRQEQHEALARAAAAQGAKRSTLTNGVSLHVMKENVSFSDLRAVLASAKEHESRAFVGTLDGAIVFSVNFNFAPPDQRGPDGGARGKSKKRSRDPDEETVEHAVERLLKGSSSTPPEKGVHRAKQALHALLAQLRGSGGERVLESWGLFYKQIDSVASARPQLIVSARLTPGVAVLLKGLFDALGKHCSVDGMLTTHPSTLLGSDFDLPLGEQAKAAEAHGQRSIILVATVDAAA